MNNYVQTLIGVDSLDATLLIDQKQVLYVPIATAEKFGMVRIGEGLTINNGLVTLDADIEPAIADLQANKQDKIDETLETEDKSVVGAINSLNTRIETNENDIDSLETRVSTKLEAAPVSSVPLININGKIDNRYLPAETIGFKYGGSFGSDGLIVASAYAPELNGILIDTIDKEAYIGFYFKITADYTLESILYNTNDLVLSNGVDFLKIDNTDAVTSVNGKNGAVVLLGSDITATIDVNDVETLATITEHLQRLEDIKENKVAGKGLSTNDFTDTLKNRLDGIEANAEVNIIETIKVNDISLIPVDKTINILIPTEASDVNALPDSTKYGATIDLTYTSSTGILGLSLKDQDGTELNYDYIDLPMELIIQSGSVETCIVDDEPVIGYVIGDKYLDLVLANGNHIYILASDFIDQITIVETGNGNAVTDISINGSTLTETKGKTFVEVVAGKDLSTNDLTNELKTNYDTAYTNTHTHSNQTTLDDITAAYTTSDASKLSGIEAGAEVNIIETVKVNGTALTPTEKAVDVTVPTKTSDLTNDSGFVEEIWDGSIATSFAGGTGTEEDPYLISNGAELAYLAQISNAGVEGATLGKYYKQTNDIVLNKNSYSYKNWGTTAPNNTWTPIGDFGTFMRFQGNYDGCNYKIIGCYINNTLQNQGIFGYIENATIKNVENVNSYIYSNDFYVGGIVGRAKVSCLIDNCINNGLVHGARYTGGIVGSGTSTNTVRNCKNNGEISGSYYIGGIIGISTDSIVRNCFNIADVNGYQEVGGIIGTNLNPNEMSNCYNIGTVTGTTSVGSLVGRDNNAGTKKVGYSYYIAGTNPIGLPQATNIYLSPFEIDNQILENPITIDDIEYNDLTNALNAWVIYNQYWTTSYLTWVKQSGAVEDRLPILTTNDTWVDLDKIEAEIATKEVNVIETIKVNDVALTPTEKTVSFTVPTQASDIDALPDTTKYGSTIDLTYTASTGVLGLVLKDQDGTTLSTETVDLPLELIITSGSVGTCTVDDEPVVGYVVGDKHLDLVLASGGHIYILASDFIDQITITETGTGNAVTDISINGSVLTETKGKTFVETSRKVAGKALTEDITLSSSDLTDSTNLIKGATIYGGTIVDNLDTINKNGFYTCYGTATGVPSSSYSWFILHENSNAGTVSAKQTATAYLKAAIVEFVRVKTISSWGPWKKYEMTSNQVTSISESSNDAQYPSAKCVYDQLLLKVDKVAGKGLSTNDFTDTLKNRLDGIEANAEVNVQSDWNQTTDTADDYIKNKPTIPEGVVAVDNLTSTSTTSALSANQGKVLNDNKVPNTRTINGLDLSANRTLTQDNIGDGTTYKQFSATEKTKLSGIATGAEVNVQSDWNASSGDALILNKPTIPTNSSFTLAGLSEKSYNSLTDKPTIPVNSSFTLAGLSEKNFSSLASKPTTISGYGITDAAKTDASNITASTWLGALLPYATFNLTAVASASITAGSSTTGYVNITYPTAIPTNAIITGVSVGFETEENNYPDRVPQLHYVTNVTKTSARVYWRRHTTGATDVARANLQVSYISW